MPLLIKIQKECTQDLQLTLRIGYVPIVLVEKKQDKNCQQKRASERNEGGGFNNYYFYTGLEVPNYKNKFVNLYPNVHLEPKLLRILEYFSEFHVKLLEQALISYYKPEINNIEV